jgi:hypothetical protein
MKNEEFKTGVRIVDGLTHGPTGGKRGTDEIPVTISLT